MIAGLKNVYTGCAEADDSFSPSLSYGDHKIAE